MRRCAAFVLSLSFLYASAAQSDTVFQLRQTDSGHVDIRSVIATSRELPFDKKYEEFNPAQKAILSAMYEHMEEGDEPPFPRDGLEPVIRLIHKAQARYLADGDLTLVVEVGEDGVATSVKAIGMPDKELVKFATSVVLLIPYKPARCKGVPCSQQFPYFFAFETD